MGLVRDGESIEVGIVVVCGEVGLGGLVGWWVAGYAGGGDMRAGRGPWRSEMDSN